MAKPHAAALRSKVFQGDVVELSGGAANVNLDVDDVYRHYFLAVEFYSDADGETKVDPTAGAITFKAKTPVLPNDFQDFTDNSVADLSNGNEQVNFGTPATQVRAEISSVSGNGATHARLRAVGCVS